MCITDASTRGAQVMAIASRLLRRMHTYEQVVHFNMLAGQLVGAQAGSGVPSAAGAAVAAEAGSVLSTVAALLCDSRAPADNAAREPAVLAGAPEHGKPCCASSHGLRLIKLISHVAAVLFTHGTALLRLRFRF